MHTTNSTLKQQDARATKPPPAPLAHVFVGTDFSTGAARAVARAGLLPLAEHGRISVMHVLPEVPKKVRRTAEHAARGQLEQTTAALASALNKVGSGKVSVLPILAWGQPYVELIRHARTEGAALLVLGRHGRRTVKDMLIGTTTERIIREGDLPVLVVNRQATRSYRRPVVAVELEDTAHAVIATALRLLGPEVKAATMAHACHVPFEGFVALGASEAEMTTLRRQHEQTAAASLAQLQDSYRQVGIRWRSSILSTRGEDPRLAILAEATRRRADLLAVGTHGRSGLSHALLGSVAEWVIQAARCDVLVSRIARVSFRLP